MTRRFGMLVCRGLAIGICAIVAGPADLFADQQPSAAAAPAQLTPQDIARIKKEVTAAIHQYYRFYTERNMKAMGDQVYFAPFIGVGANGITVQATPDAVTKNHEGALKRLLDSDWDRSEFPNPTVCVMNAGAALASGTFSRYRKDGTVISTNGITYWMGKAADGWKILSFTGHAQGKLVQCND